MDSEVLRGLTTDDKLFFSSNIQLFFKQYLLSPNLGLLLGLGFKEIVSRVWRKVRGEKLQNIGEKKILSLTTDVQRHCVLGTTCRQAKSVRWCHNCSRVCIVDFKERSPTACTTESYLLGTACRLEAPVRSRPWGRENGRLYS